MKIQLLSDNPDGWILPYVEEVEQRLSDRGHEVRLVTDYRDLQEGDLAFFLSCTTVVPPAYLQKNDHNLVVHASDLPEGRGWSPVQWQVLNGVDQIPVTLLEAAEQADSGDIYDQEIIELDGTELLPELREKVGRTTIDLVLRFVEAYPEVEGTPQNEANATYFPRRTPEDSELDPEQTIKEQFNQLRVVDNENYPAFFTLHGETYILKIFKEESAS